MVESVIIAQKMPDPAHSRLTLDPSLARSLAAQFGTPLYVLSEAILRRRCVRYREAVKATWSDSIVAYASKANSTLSAIAIAAEEGCWIDVASEGELRAASLAGVSPSRCIFHGNNKSPRELLVAIETGVGFLVVDNFVELNRLFGLLESMDEPIVHDAGKSDEELLDAALGRKQNGLAARCPNILLRLAPAVDPDTHEKISTGQADTKFGFSIQSGAAEKAVVMCLGLNLPLRGYHCHVGSQLHEPGAQVEGATNISSFALDMALKHQFWPRVINVGGGIGVDYLNLENQVDVDAYCQSIAESVIRIFRDQATNITLIHEPGRWMIAEAGVTLYSVGSIKVVPLPSGAEKTYVSVDGGLSDNPRPALYGALYSVEAISQDEMSDADEPVMAEYTVSGKHCETDTLFPRVQLPVGIRDGDLLQVFCTGAYNASMVSNYNRLPRPACVLLPVFGEPKLIVRREEIDEMFSRELFRFEAKC